MDNEMVCKPLVMSGSPHDHTAHTTRGVMWRVVIALLPALLTGFWVFGLPAVTVTLVTVAACVLAEFLITRYMMGRPYDWTGGSAVVTGVLLAMSLPAGLPWWICVIGAVAAIGIGKMAFGGLGCNIFNPAMVGRVFLLLSFPAQMTTWLIPDADGATGATWLALASQETAHTGASSAAALPQVTAPDIVQALSGYMGGSLGEVGSVALMLGFVYLLVTRIVNWEAPAAILVTVAVMSLATGADMAAQLLSGGLLLGALFMATDYVTSPMSGLGRFVFGLGIGLITFIIRQWGSYPEGVSFAILVMNGLVPLINRCCKPRKFGERRLEL